MRGRTVGGDAGGLMDRIVVVVAIGMGLTFATGVPLVVIVMIAAAIRREDKWNSLTREPPDAAARGVQRPEGVGLRDIMPPDPKPVRG
jgi:hypothetical protein